jgi:hypothetical protein
MECAEIKFRLTDYEEGALESLEQQMIRSHLKECRACEGFHSHLNRAWSSLDNLPAADPDPFSCKRFLTNFQKENKQSFSFLSVLNSGKHRFRFAIYFLSSAFVAVLLVYAALAVRQRIFTANQMKRAGYSAALSEFSTSIFKPDQVFPDSLPEYSYSSHAAGELSSFNLGSARGPLPETIKK